MIARTVLTPQLATTASMLVRLAHPNNQSLHRALSKAETRLVELPWRVDGGVLCIASHSNPDDCHYTDGETCDCPTTRGVCWHIASWLLVATLAGTAAHVTSPMPWPIHLDEIDLPASFLDGDFSAFEDTSILGPVAAMNVYEHFIETDDPTLTRRGASPAPIPFKAGPSREHVPAVGSELERLQRLVDELVAA